MFADLAQNAAGNAHCDHIRRNILRHNAARADDGIVADRHAGHDEDTCAQPAVFPDVNRHIVLVNQLAQFRIDRMSRRGDHAVRAEHGVVADVNVRVIHESQVEIGVNILAEMDVMSAPVCVERRFDVAVVADFGEHILQHFRPLAEFRRTGLVEVVELFEARALFTQDVGVFAEIQLPALHFFFHGHDRIPP